MKSVQIRSFSDPYSVRMRENTDQKKLRIWTLFTQCKVSGHISKPIVSIGNSIGLALLARALGRSQHITIPVISINTTQIQYIQINTQLLCEHNSRMGQVQSKTIKCIFSRISQQCFF